jgi:hypothetical protein
VHEEGMVEPSQLACPLAGQLDGSSSEPTESGTSLELQVGLTQVMLAPEYANVVPSVSVDWQMAGTLNCAR